MADTPKDKKAEKAKLQHLQKYSKIKKLIGMKRNGGGEGIIRKLQKNIIYPLILLTIYENH